MNPRDDVDTLYVSRNEGRRGFVSMEDSVYTSIQRLEECIENRGGRLLTATGNNTDNTRTKRTEITCKQKWKEKQLCGYFKRQTSDISPDKTWT